MAAELPASLPGYTILPNRVLGSGHEAVVTAAIDQSRLVRVALKVHRKATKSAIDLGGMKREAHALLFAVSPHPNLIRAFGMAETPDFFALALEFAPQGDLLQLLIKHDRFEEKRAAFIGRQIVKGLAHLHRCGYVHNDVKLDNILVFPGDRFVLSDLGFVAPIDRTNREAGVSDACGSPSYAAPELWTRQNRLGASADVWAFAVVLYAMVVGYLPFKDNTDTIFGEFSWPGSSVSDEFHALIGFAFQTNKTLRPSLAQVRAHRWFSVHRAK